MTPEMRRAAVLRVLGILRWAALFAAALFLFVFAIQAMKGGAKAIAPSLQGSVFFGSGAATLGAGWLGAYFVLSGSPIAAVSLGLFSGGAITPFRTFTMLSGSRLGASFIVLLVGFLYAVRNREADRRQSIGMGILALTLTAIVYLPGMLLGYTILERGLLDAVRWQASSEALSLIDVIWGPALDLFRSTVPTWLQVPAGLGIILVSFRFLDAVLPQVDAEHAEKRQAWMDRRWTMFLLGCVVATLTLSVSVALTVLVPLASRGYVRRETAIPYIMGANITTLADTLVAAMLTGNAVAVQIVLAEAIGVTIISLLYLAIGYERIRGAILAFDDWVVGTTRRLTLFVGVLFILPAVLLTSGIWLRPFAS